MANNTETLEKVELVQGNKRYGDVNQDISRPLESLPEKWWWAAFAVALGLLTLLVVEIGYLIATGMGVVGVNVPVSWGSFIITFVFWIDLQACRANGKSS